MLSYKTWDVVCFISCCRSNFLLVLTTRQCSARGRRVWGWPVTSYPLWMRLTFSVSGQVWYLRRLGGSRSCANFSDVTWWCGAARIRLTLTFAAEAAVGCYLTLPFTDLENRDWIRINNHGKFTKYPWWLRPLENVCCDLCTIWDSALKWF